MPAKREKSKKKRRGLSDKELIKLLKKLKPKNQQTVRINIGDKKGKQTNKAGQVQSTYNPPFILQAQTALPFTAPTPKYEPLKPQPLPISQQPQLQPWTNTTPATDTEPEVTKVKEKRAYRRRQPEIPIPYPYDYARQFNTPYKPSGSALGEYSLRATHFKEPVINDTFFQVEISGDLDSDHAGVIHGSLASDEWNLSPDGLVQSIGEQTSTAEAAAAEPAAAADSAPTDLIEEITPSRRPYPTEARPASAKKSSFNDDVSRLNAALISGEYDKSNIPQGMISLRGTSKGGLKRTGLTEEKFRPVYNAYIDSLDR